VYNITIFIQYYNIYTILQYLYNITIFIQYYNIYTILQYLYNITIFIQYYNIYTILQYSYNITIFIQYYNIQYYTQIRRECQQQRQLCTYTPLSSRGLSIWSGYLTVTLNVSGHALVSMVGPTNVNVSKSSRR
jgi:hypothetical protein